MMKENFMLERFSDTTTFCEYHPPPSPRSAGVRGSGGVRGVVRRDEGSDEEGGKY